MLQATFGCRSKALFSNTRQCCRDHWRGGPGPYPVAAARITRTRSDHCHQGQNAFSAPAQTASLSELAREAGRQHYKQWLMSDIAKINTACIVRS